MRLIDIRKQKKIEIEHERYDYVRGCMEGYNTCIEDLETVPKVKAIPIEWINSYTTGLIFSDDYVDNADSIDYYIDCIKEMVRDWEKENETN